MSSVLVGLFTAVYAALATSAIHRARRYRDEASIYLAAVFVTLGVTGAVFVLTESVLASTSLERGATLVGFAGLLVYPTLLLAFVHRLRPLPTRARVLVGLFCAGLGGMLAWQEIGDDMLPAAVRTSLGVLLLVYGLVWALAHAIAATSLWRSGKQRGSSLARRRATAMAIGTGGLGGVFVVILLVPAASAEAALGLGIASAVCVWLGFSPPTSVRLIWSVKDVEALTTAEERLLSTGDTDVVATQLLPAVTRLLDGDAAWLTEGDALLAVHGAPVADLDDVWALLGPGPASRPVEILHVADDRWLVAAPTGSGWLTVRTSVEPVLFGAAQTAGLRSVAVRTNLLLRRAELDLRERETDRRLREARHLSEVTQLKDDVLSTLSHELRTPLVTIRGASEMLVQRWAALPEDQRLRFVERIDANARDLHGVVSDTLQLASLRAGAANVRIRPVRLEDTLAIVTAELSVGDLARLSTDVHGIDLETDGEQFAAIVRQLVSNALKFSEDLVEVTAEQGDAWTTVTVTDRGPGLDAEALARVDEPMYRTGDVLRRGTRGLGIGLTLATSIAEALGGSVHVRSQPGTGTAASVTVPTNSVRPIPSSPRTTTTI